MATATFREQNGFYSYFDRTAINPMHVRVCVCVWRHVSQTIPITWLRHSARLYHVTSKPTRISQNENKTKKIERIRHNLRLIVFGASFELSFEIYFINFNNS